MKNRKNGMRWACGLLCACLAMGLMGCGQKGPEKASGEQAGSSSISESSEQGTSSAASEPSTGTVGSSESVSGSTSEKPAGTASSAEQKPGSGDERQPEQKKMTVKEFLTYLCKGISLPPQDMISLQQDNFQDYAFVDWQKGMEAVASEGQIATNAHSLVLIRCANAPALAKQMADRVDAQKWVCVQAEVNQVLYTDEFVLLVMSSKQVYQPLKAHFEASFAKGAVKQLDVKSAAAR